VFDCLASPKTSHKVCEFVVGVAINLLTLESDEEVWVKGKAVDARSMGRGDDETVGADDMEKSKQEGGEKGEGVDMKGSVEAMDADSTERKKERKAKQNEVEMEGVDKKVEVMEGEEASGSNVKDGSERQKAGDAEDTGRESTVSRKDLVTPFIPCLLAYLNRVIGENVGKGGRVKERGRSLESEFVMLSR
jgi:hypothetical protein